MDVPPLRASHTEIRAEAGYMTSVSGTRDRCMRVDLTAVGKMLLHMGKKAVMAMDTCQDNVAASSALAGVVEYTQDMVGRVVARGHREGARGRLRLRHST